MLRARAAGMRVIAVSDSWYSAQELQELLARHQVEGIERVYSSSDLGASKFTGRLFARVFQEERIEPHALLHLGDSRLADDYSARAAGAAALRVPRSRPSTPRLSVPSTDPAFQLGATVLGPALAFFTHIALLRAERDRMDELAFVARDGDLLLEVARILQPAVPVLYRPALRYVYLSRRSTALASYGSLDASAVAAALAIPAAGASVEGVFALVGLDPANFTADLYRAGLDAHTGNIGSYAQDERVRRLVDDPSFDAPWARRRRLSAKRSAPTCDRRGSSAGAVLASSTLAGGARRRTRSSSAFGRDRGVWPALRGYYLGLWADPGNLGPPRGLGCEGGAAHQTSGAVDRPREGRGVVYSPSCSRPPAAHHMAPSSGTGAATGGRIEPQLLETGREQNGGASEGSGVQLRIREGVRWAVERYAEREARVRPR